MRRFWGVALLVPLLALGAWAQMRGGGGFRGGGHGGGFTGGRIGGGGSFHGGGFRGPIGYPSRGVYSGRPISSGFGNVVFPSGDLFSMRLRGYRPGLWYGGIYPYTGLGFGYGYGYGFGYPYSSYGYSPYDCTPFFGGVAAGSYCGYTSAYRPEVIVMPQTAPVVQSAPPVIVNQYSPPPAQAQPVVEEYPEGGPVRHDAAPASPAGAPRAGDYRSEYYLIALKSGLIQAVLAYWVDAGQLHYITRDRAMKQVPLTQVDVDFSAQLNRERRVPFRLPGA